MKDYTEIEKLAYAMEKAYRFRGNLHFACNAVKEEHPDADNEILAAMWHAIDAYVDIQDSL